MDFNELSSIEVKQETLVRRNRAHPYRGRCPVDGEGILGTKIVIDRHLNRQWPSTVRPSRIARSDLSAAPNDIRLALIRSNNSSTSTVSAAFLRLPLVRSYSATCN